MMRQRIKAARLHAGLTQEQLGEACAVSKSAVSNWETLNFSKATNPTFDNLRCISKVTGAPVDWLLDDTVDLDHGWQQRVSESDIVSFRRQEDVEPPPVLTPEETLLLSFYRLLDTKEQSEVISNLADRADRARAKLLSDPRIKALLSAK